VLMELKVYDWPTEMFEVLKRHLCSSDLSELKAVVLDYDSNQD
jgi:chloramphenicol O-acetyltransferase type B